MKVLRSLFLTLITLLFFIPQKGTARDIVFIHLDKSIIVSGESLYFKAYLLNSNTTATYSGSRVLYIQVTDPVSKKSLLFRSDITKNGTCYGEIPVPDTLQTGYYLLTAYTNSMRNFNPGSVFTSTILVINQARKIPETLNAIAINKPSDKLTETSEDIAGKHNSIAITPNKKVFGTREKVTLDLKNLADSLSISNVSITVSRKSPFNGSSTLADNFSAYLPFITTQVNAEKDHSTTQQQPDVCRYPAEDKGYIFSGHLLDKTSLKPLRNVFVLLTVADSVANLKYALTDSSGKFDFQLEENYNNRELILQLKDSPVPAENTTISLDNKTFNSDFFTLKTTNLDSIASDFMVTSQQLAMIDKIFISRNIPDTMTKEVPFQNYTFFGKPEEIIKPSEFIEMPNLEDIVANIVRNAKYKVTEDQSTILVADDLSHQFHEGHNAMVLLNNVPLFDYAVINSLGSKQIQRIELKTKHMYYGDLEIFGILSVFTNENYIPYLESKHQVFSFPNNVVMPVKIHSSPDYTTDEKKNSKIPDFRQTLYWNPDFEINNSMNNTIGFYTSDLKTSYDIVIQGITKNGIPLSASTTIEVR